VTLTRRSCALPRGRRGSSLLEVIVAIVVFAIGFLSLVGGSLIASRTMKDSRDLAVVSAAAESMLDSLKAGGWTAIGGRSGAKTVRGHALTWQVTGNNPRMVLVVVTRHTWPRAKYDSLLTFVAK
jgi:prepilin-type N-terminal cleavage/methylation domain-containing protein